MYRRIIYRINIMKRLFPYAKGVRALFFINILVAFVLMGCELGYPIFYKIFINQVILGQQFSKIYVIFIGYISIFIISSAFGYIKIRTMFRIINTVLHRVKSKLWIYFLNLPFEQYDSLEAGTVKLKIEDDSDQIKAFANTQTIDYFVSYVMAIVSCGILFSINWKLTVFSIISIPITFMLDSYVSKREYKLNEFNRENDEELLDWFHMILRNWKEVRALGLEKRCKIQYVHYLHNYALYFAKWINYWTLRILVIPKIKDEFFMRFGLYFLGGFLIIYNEIGIDDLLLFAIYFENFSAAIKNISTSDADLLSSMALTDRFIEDLNQAECIDLNKKSVCGNIETVKLEKLSFSYNKTEIVQKLSLELNRGDCVGIVGKSGSGKSTLLKLLMGVLTPTHGKILINNIDITDIDIESVHKNMGVMLQDLKLFNASIKQNICLWDDKFSIPKFEKACVRANIYNDILSMPNGLETIIGEGGAKLSGGQQQRIILARIFYQDPDMFILDEATSALDPLSESVICESISMLHDKIIILVDHRGTLLKLCNKIINIEALPDEASL